MTSDLVNGFFRKHYPADHNEAWETQWCVNHAARKYTGAASTIFPSMKCADGFEMSVQGHFGAYSYPRDDFADHYAQVEISTRADAEPLFADYKDGTYGEGDKSFTIYGYVPISVVEEVINKHGGLSNEGGAYRAIEEARM